MRSFELSRSTELLVVGSGFFGLTVARLAAEAGHAVQLIEKRPHLGGNSYSYVDPQTGVEVHKYGSHLFHTSNSRVWNFVNRFTSFNDYRHTVKTVHNGEIFSMPINLGTISQFYRKRLSPTEARELVEAAASKFPQGEDFQSRALSQIGEGLYEAFIKGYTEKQWQVNPRDLPSSIFSRLPIRYNFDDRYFSDKWEGLPLIGYSGLVEAIASHPNIMFSLEVDFFDFREEMSRTKIPVVYTGPIDTFFDYRFGRLNWRTLDFEFMNVEVNDFQGTSVMNFADLDVPHTRVHEFKHLHPEREHKTGLSSIAFEYSRFAALGDEPYYPVNSVQDREALLAYRSLAASEQGVFFGGRLGSYKYLDMHMAIASAINTFEVQVEPYLKSNRIR